MITNSPFLNVRILSLSARIFEGEVQACLMPTPEGATKVLPRHMPVAGRLSKGTICITHDNGHQDFFEVENGGFYRVSPDSAHLWVY